jgi:hypothetical protein
MAYPLRAGNLLLVLAGVVAGAALVAFLLRRPLLFSSTLLTNREEWEMVRNPITGRLERIVVHRAVRHANGF